MTFLLVQPKQYDFVPQDDMTPLEAVWIAHLFTWVKWAVPIENHPQWEKVKRHFAEVKE